MQAAWNFIVSLLNETWLILTESSPWILFGFIIAAIIKAFIPDSLVYKHLGGKGFMPVLKAALFGVPLPLCSCGVIPAALSLKRQGASNGATTAFLISTPETGVDSIAITWALMDPIVTVFRPVAAFLTAIVAGLLENLSKPVITQALEMAHGCSACACACSQPSLNELPKSSVFAKLKDGFSSIFGEFLSDIGLWLLLGILIAGLISVLIPEDFLSVHLGNNFIQMVVMLLIGLPMYVCASSSTPIAAALVLKGLSPGAALVFLLAGPASNAATMTVISKTMGKRSLAIYLGSIAVMSLVMGLILDWIYASSGLRLVPRIAFEDNCCAGWFQITCAILLLLLIVRGYIVSRK